MIGGSIRTPDQRLRVFVSSTLAELAAERAAVREAIERLQLTPVLFELGARPHPPRDLYRAYLEQSQIFIGIYWQRLERLGATYLPQRWVEDGRYLTGAEVSAGIDTALRLAGMLTNDDVARMVQLAIEYDPQPPHGGIDWPHVDRDSFSPRVEGFAHQALDDHPELLSRLLGSQQGS